jgi:hypothetical protein
MEWEGSLTDLQVSNNQLYWVQNSFLGQEEFLRLVPERLLVGHLRIICRKVRSPQILPWGWPWGLELEASDGGDLVEGEGGHGKKP